MALVAFALSGAARSEECLKLELSLLGQDSARDGNSVIEPRVVRETEEGVDGAAFGVGCSVDESVDPRVDQRSGAHWAWFERDVEGCAMKTPSTERDGCSFEYDEFCVRGRIAPGLAAVVIARDEIFAEGQYGPNRDFAL